MTTIAGKAASGSNRFRIIFITGTDTGVGKTLLTGLLLCHLRQNGCRALALKPFSSGNRADAQLLHALQDGDLGLEQINPFHFPESVAPLVAARKHRQETTLHQVLNRIGKVAAFLNNAAFHHSSIPSSPPSTNPLIHQSTNLSRAVLIEGVGGLLVPLGKDFSVLDLIANLSRGQYLAPGIPLETIVVSRNRLGTINHTLLTVTALQSACVQHVKVVLMDRSRGDSSTRSNPRTLAGLLGAIPLFHVPFLGPHSLRIGALKNKSKKMKKVLAQILS